MNPFPKPRRPRFVMAFTKLIRDPTISAGAKVVLLVIKSYAGKETAAFPSAATIAGDCGMDRKTVFKHIKELKDKRVIDVVNCFDGGGQTSNAYTLDDEHYARHLAKKRGWRKRNTRVVAKTEHEVDALKKSKVLQFPASKEA